MLRTVDATAVRQADFEEVINPAEAFDLEAGRSYIAVTELAECSLILEDSSTVGRDQRVALVKLEHRIDRGGDLDEIAIAT